MKKHLFSAAIIALTVLLSGCISPEFYINGYRGPESPIRVAAILPLSGTNKIPAEQMKAGLLQAEHEINNNSATGKKKLILRLFDSKGTIAGTDSAMLQAAKWGASGIIAGYNTEEVSAIIRLSGKLQMPTVIPLATATEHTAVSPFVYRNSYTDFQQTETLANYLLHWRQAKHLGIFIDAGKELDYQSSLSRDVSQHLQDIGGSITRTAMIKSIPNQREITDMLKSDPEAIMLTYGGKNAAETIKKLRNSGFTGIICGADNWDSDELISALDNFKVGDCLYVAFFNDDNPSPEYQKFKSDFRKRFFYHPGACETQSYDALKFLLVGLEKAETLPEFDRNWRKIKFFQGAAATYTMRPKGDIDRTIYINSIGVKRENGKIKPYARLSHKMQYSKLREYKLDYYQ